MLSRTVFQEGSSGGNLQNGNADAAHGSHRKSNSVWQMHCRRIFAPAIEHVLAMRDAVLRAAAARATHVAVPYWLCAGWILTTYAMVSCR